MIIVCLFFHHADFNLIKRLLYQHEKSEAGFKNLLDKHVLNKDKEGSEGHQEGLYDIVFIMVLINLEEVYGMLPPHNNELLRKICYICLEEGNYIYLHSQ